MFIKETSLRVLGIVFLIVSDYILRVWVLHESIYYSLVTLSQLYLLQIWFILFLCPPIWALNLLLPTLFLLLLNLFNENTCTSLFIIVVLIPLTLKWFYIFLNKLFILSGMNTLWWFVSIPKKRSVINIIM
jgi:hypothetical protein